jgi:hypothetical protein
VHCFLMLSKKKNQCVCKALVVWRVLYDALQSYNVQPLRPFIFRELGEFLLNMLVILARW